MLLCRYTVCKKTELRHNCYRFGIIIKHRWVGRPMKIYVRNIRAYNRLAGTLVKGKQDDVVLLARKTRFALV